MSTPPPPFGPPQAGWYPDPQAVPGSGGLRWWDGTRWTPHTHDPMTATQGWSKPGAPGAATAAGSVPGAGFVGGRDTGLTASGMRPIDDFFSDIGRILQRAWMPLLAVSLLVWVVAGALVALISAPLIDSGALRSLADLVTQMEGASQAELEALEDQAELLLTEAFPQSVGVYVAAGVALALLFLAAWLVQVTAVSRIAMDAAAGRDVSMATGWQGVAAGAPRLFVYALLVFVSIVAVSIAFSLLVVLLAALWVPAAVLFGLLGGLGLTLLAVWVFTRLALVSAQCVVGPRPARWSWRATRGRFWAVLGRYLLWSVLMSMAMNVVGFVLFAPADALLTSQPTAEDFAAALSGTLTVSLVLMPIYQALAGLSCIGVVPIWRDLTDNLLYSALPGASAGPETAGPGS